MRRAVIALIATVVVVILLASFRTHQPSLRALALPPVSARSNRSASTSTTPPTATRSTTTTARARTTRTTTRSATGAAVQYRYGLVQVKATVRGGRLTGVQTVTLAPDGGGRSASIDAQAEPLLRQEALQAHSANIDVISGATYTSQAYAQSLQSAIDRARHA